MACVAFVFLALKLCSISVPAFVVFAKLVAFNIFVVFVTCVGFAAGI